MATRKQKRRRAKEQRHEYVWVDDEGNELEPDSLASPKEETRSRARRSRPVREVQAPSWRRTLKRALVFAPIMLVTVMLLSSDLALSQQIVQAALIVAVFIPFSYFLDRLFYRSYQRRLARRKHAEGGRGS